MRIKQAVILAGGLGTRLGTKTLNCPKPMQLVDQRPFLDNILWNLKRHQIDEIILSIGYLSEQFKSYYKDGSSLNLKINYVEEDEPAGTGGALKKSLNLLDNYFFLINGDTLFDINFHDLASSFIDEKIGHLALNFVDDVSRYGEVKLQGSEIVSFNEKGNDNSGYVNGGVGVFSKKLINFITESPCSLEKDIFPKLLKKKLLTARKYNSFFLDIGIPETLKSAETLIPSWRKKAALFLDRDGVINVDHGYVHSMNKFEWIKDAKKTIKLANDLGILVFVITNQSGIGRGYYSVSQFIKLTNEINNKLIQYGAHIDQTYFCPHHPLYGIGEMKKNCNFRKPNTGMIDKAILEWKLDKKKCFLIGDKKTDIEAGERSGIVSFLFNYEKDSLINVFKDKLSELI